MESVAGPAFLDHEDLGIMFKIQMLCGRGGQQWRWCCVLLVFCCHCERLMEQLRKRLHQRAPHFSSLLSKPQTTKG